MSDDQGNKSTYEEQKQPGEAWEEVGRQFQTLGEKIGEAFRTAWNSEETRQNFQKMQSGLEGMISEIRQAMKDTVDTEDVEQFKAEARKAAETLRDQGEQTYQEVRPHMVNALQELNAELQKLIDRMEKKEQDESSQ